MIEITKYFRPQPFRSGGRRSVRWLMLSVGMIMAYQVCDVQSLQGQTQPGDAAKANADRSADEEAIRANVQSFVDAYGARDAAALAELFSPNAQIMTIDGETIEGREAIEEALCL